jgi:hypothetical protein
MGSATGECIQVELDGMPAASSTVRPDASAESSYAPSTSEYASNVVGPAARAIARNGARHRELPAQLVELDKGRLGGDDHWLVRCPEVKPGRRVDRHEPLLNAD